MMRTRATASAHGHDLGRRCERALTAAARGAGTRQQVRAAARRFVRRHRRDQTYLEWALRCAAGSAALAIALLGLGAEPARAKATLFTPGTSLAYFDGYERIAPTLGDLDGDGDLDLAEGSLTGELHYFENTGSAASPDFVMRGEGVSPLWGLDVGSDSAPAFRDLDGDGDLDLVAGELYGTFHYFENTGSATSPEFVERNGGDNPLDGLDVDGLLAKPAFGDIDGDGDLDLVAGNSDGVFQYFQNTGNATSAEFVERTGSANPFAGQDVGGNSTPTLGDLDGDGDLDLVAGSFGGAFHYFENTGSAKTPAFVERTGSASPLAGQNLPFSHSAPALGDLDRDGDLDLVAGVIAGDLYYFENRAGELITRTGADSPLWGHDAGSVSAPAFGDLDGDGDRDLVAGNFDGVFRYFENTGSAASPVYLERTGGANPLDGQGPPASSAPTLGDFDRDGDLDLIAGEGDGVFHYFQNTGNAASPAFVERTGSANPLDGQNVGGFSTPASGDLDGDGDLDLVAGNYGGVFHYFENTGSAASPAFVERTGIANPLAGQGVVGSDSTPALGDLDGDGDLDLVSGEFFGDFYYFENTGSAQVPAFVARTGSASPLWGQQIVTLSKPAFGDLDGDGDVDVVAGDVDGVFHYFENAVVKPALRYVGPIPPPFVGVNVGTFSGVSAGDLDGDGDRDFIAAGAFVVHLYYFENTGSVLSPKVVESAISGINYAPVGALADVDADGDLDLAAAYFGTIRYYENTGGAVSPSFVELVDGANPFDGIEGEGYLRIVPALGDLDGDGDLDLVAGGYYGDFRYFANTGSATSPAFVELAGGANPLDGQDVGDSSIPAIGDVDRDGDLDLVAGDSTGVFHYYENTGTALAPAFALRTGEANPLDGEDVGIRSSPSFVDLDGDGDLDVVSGNGDGALIPYYLPEPSRASLLGAGAALLAWLRWIARGGSPRSRRAGCR
jgi:large repetitive protein